MNLYNLENKYCDQSGFNIKKTIIIFSVVLLVLYGFFNARNLIAGPSFEILSPTTEIETKEKIIEVKGRVKNTSFLSINERPIKIDTDGFFEEKLLLSPGFNIIEIKARDRFKKETSQKIKVYYQENLEKEEVPIIQE